MNLMDPLFPDRCFSRADKCDSASNCCSHIVNM